MRRTLRETVAAVRAVLEAAGIEGAAREARLIAGHAGGIARERVSLSMEAPVSAAQREAALAMGRARAARRPLSHLLGYRDFFDHRFAVSGDVLDPRPETEALVLAALEATFARVLDLGTGSGAILLSLLAARPEARGLGTDLSEAALAVARENAQALGVAGRCEFLVSDWFGAVEGRFDLIVSNPPYIAVGEMAGLAPELGHEPRMALTDEGDGLDAYRAITGGVVTHLEPGGRLLLEIGSTQGRAVAEMIRVAGLENIRVHPDLDGRDRVVSARMPQKRG
ncbi:peptide chain release factor N(5)-glutamine methyltransferase [Aquicoccus porphyridii]|uniref:peptide chain release factor N(5)-glutamine methyltransferase n=1 Tax=Aquicoccus porphyridii TaxID=1852029 RepID=UPI001FE4FECC|nr:peptide chain release factor N(5)-glutamine methyltransferase [Aquicoccus porphyridii]